MALKVCQAYEKPLSENVFREVNVNSLIEKKNHTHTSFVGNQLWCVRTKIVG